MAVINLEYNIIAKWLERLSVGSKLYSFDFWSI